MMIVTAVLGIGFIFALAGDFVLWAKLDEQRKATAEEYNRRWDEISRAVDLEKQLDNKMVPHWISVEERLPDVAEKVITYNGDFVSENWLCTVASKDGRINVWAYSEGFVTHWMPLPEPPKEVERMNLDLTKDLLYKAHEEFIEEASKNRAVKHEQEVKNFRDFAIALRDEARKIKNGNVPFPERVDK